MRLKRLTLQAFGPFKDKVVIDFESDKIDKGLLLISGDTGSGKTTIFDAICYALYGEASNSIRSSKSFKSDYADINTLSYVDLIFIQSDKMYHIRREPAQYVLSKRKNKDGLILFPAGIVFFKRQRNDESFDLEGYVRIVNMRGFRILKYSLEPHAEFAY